MRIKLFDGNRCWNSERMEIRVEEFDALEGKHIFSDDYERKKQKLLEDLKKGKRTGSRKKMYKAAAALALICVIGSTTVYAVSADHRDIFDSLWGNSTKKNIPVHEVEVEGNEGSVMVTVPSMEYVSVDPEKADQVLEDRIMDTPIVKQIGDHTLTIQSVVYDKNGAVIYYTLEREGGVTMLVGDDSTNQSKGAYFSEESTEYFQFGGCELTYIDLEKSTRDKLYCCVYQVAWGDSSKRIVPELTIWHFPFQWRDGDMTEEEIKEYDTNTTEETISITDKQPLDVYPYAAPNEGSLEISAIDMSIDLGTDLPENCSVDNLRSVEIRYKDGTSYLVYDKENYINNTGYLCGGLDEQVRIAFNRLVDTDAIDLIVVNGVEYQAQ
ncbi:MAG: hypothetical protein IJ801_10075 [Lachnospiraceae bacterium]|nr:hypothetical protein [Lachnospiraceae bacterium]